jgi:hypothetical protein
MEFSHVTFQQKYMEQFVRGLMLTDFCSGSLQLKISRRQLYLTKVSRIKFQLRFEMVCRVLAKYIYGLI